MPRNSTLKVYKYQDQELMRRNHNKALFYMNNYI